MNPIVRRRIVMVQIEKNMHVRTSLFVAPLICERLFIGGEIQEMRSVSHFGSSGKKVEIKYDTEQQKPDKGD